jgi:hypothetical protein
MPKRGSTTTADPAEDAVMGDGLTYGLTEGVLGTIKYFSIIGKDGEVLINVLQKQADNPVQSAIPMLKVNSVADFTKKLKSMGGKEVLPQMVCPCTNAYFAIWTDAFGNQMLIKEPKGTAATVGADAA